MKIILITVGLLLVLAVNAFAADQQQGTVTLSIPGIFDLYWVSGDGNWTFTPTEAQILAGNVLLTQNRGFLGVVSNYNGTKIYVQRGDWIPVNNPASDGEFKLEIRNHVSEGNVNFVTIPDTHLGGSPQEISTWPKGTTPFSYQVRYRLSQFGVADDPDVYNTTVTYTLTHP